MENHDLEVDDIRDIADFLAKPMPVSSGTFTTSNVPGDTLLNADLFTLFNTQAIWVNKIQGFLNMRGDVKLRLVINPTPFQAGLLRIGYFPCANQLSLEMQSHLLNRMVISQTPGAYLNLNTNFVEVTVPYVAPVSFIERDLVATAQHCSWGNVFIHVMEPLRTGTGPTSVNWTLWMSIENLQLSGMVQPQMLGFQPQMSMERRKGRNALDEEQNDGRGPVTKIMSSGVKLARDMAAIPMLQPIATPASWVLSAVGNLCESFGWSKPTISEHTGTLLINQNHMAINTRGGDNSAPLALDPDNKLQIITDASPGGQDEMSFQYVHSKWSFLTDVNWPTTGAAGGILFSQGIGPKSFKISQTVGTTTVYSVPPCAVGQELYSLYRGSFEVRLRIIKTGFHTGTLAVAYVPGAAGYPLTYSDTAYVYRQIIDIQDGSDFVFNLPYMIPQEFSSVGDIIGRFVIYVVNPLVAPATVASSVDVFMEVRGGPDLQYAVPRGLTATPFVPQGIVDDESGESTAVTLGSRNHDVANINHAALAVGDIQKSYLEILKAQYNLIYANATNYLGGGSGAFYLAANRFYAARYDGTNLTQAEIGGDPVSFVGSWYVMSRGSTRIRIIPKGINTTGSQTNNYRGMFLSSNSADGFQNGPYAGTTGVTYWTDQAPNATTDASFASLLSASIPAIGSSAAGYSNRIYQLPNQNGGLAVQAPFYSRYKYDLNHFVFSPGQNSLKFTSNNGVGFYANNLAFPTITRSLGDDYQFAYFVGIPCYASSSFFFNKQA